MTIQKTPFCRMKSDKKTVSTKRKGDIEKINRSIVKADGTPVEKKWYLVDAKGVPLGRLASQIAVILMGKHKPYYTPNVDVGDFVVVINSSEVLLTGNKLSDKVYYSHSGYPGGIKSVTAAQMRKKHPEKMIKLAVRRMLPKNTLAHRMLRKLRVYAGPEHNHSAQKPEPIELVR